MADILLVGLHCHRPSSLKRHDSDWLPARLMQNATTSRATWRRIGNDFLAVLQHPRLSRLSHIMHMRRRLLLLLRMVLVHDLVVVIVLMLGRQLKLILLRS